MASRSTKPRAGDVVMDYVRAQVDQIRVGDPLVRIDAPGGVHDMRVATRRLRSTLKTFRPVFRSEVVRPLRRELAWLAGRLGPVRDAEVLRARLVAAVDAQAPGAVDVADLARRIDSETAQSHLAAHDQLVAALDSERYRRLVTALGALAAAPALSRKARRPARRLLTRRTARTYAALDGLVAATRRTTGTDRERALHEVRKGAKRARYAGEALAPHGGRPATRFVAAMKALQQDLGEHRDSTVARAHLDDLAGRETSPAAAYALGRLHAMEQVRGERALEHFERSWRAAGTTSLHRWLR